jgi:hypothetical protein
MDMHVNVEADIDFEWVIKKSKTTLPVGYFVNKARYYEFPESVVKEILRAENYDVVYDKYYNMQLDNCMEQIRLARIVHEPSPSTEILNPIPNSIEISTDPSTSIETSTHTSTPMVSEPRNHSVPPNHSVPSVPMVGGLRQRLKTLATAQTVSDKIPEEKRSLTVVMNQRREQDAVVAVKCKLVLRNVPFEYVERDIYEELTDFEVTGVHVLRRAEYEGGPRQPTGTAFITLVNVSEAEDCMEYMKGICWGHNVVSAEFADK